MSLQGNPEISIPREKIEGGGVKTQQARPLLAPGRPGAGPEGEES